MSTAILVCTTIDFCMIVANSFADGRAAHHNTGYNTTGTTTGAAAGGYGTGATGYANNGPHNSKMMNKMDPRVDSDRGKQFKHTTFDGHH